MHSLVIRSPVSFKSTVVGQKIDRAFGNIRHLRPDEEHHSGFGGILVRVGPNAENLFGKEGSGSEKKKDNRRNFKNPMHLRALSPARCQDIDPAS